MGATDDAKMPPILDGTNIPPTRDSEAAAIAMPINPVINPGVASMPNSSELEKQIDRRRTMTIDRAEAEEKKSEMDASELALMESVLASALESVESGESVETDLQRDLLALPPAPPPPIRVVPRPRLDPEQRWNEFYEKLKLQHATLGHIKVLSTVDMPLYQWTYRQKRAFVDNKLTEERIAKLQVLGFDWTQTITRRRTNSVPLSVIRPAGGATLPANLPTVQLPVTPKQSPPPLIPIPLIPMQKKAAPVPTVANKPAVLPRAVAAAVANPPAVAVVPSTIVTTAHTPDSAASPPFVLHPIIIKRKREKKAAMKSKRIKASKSLRLAATKSLTTNKRVTFHSDCKAVMEENSDEMEVWSRHSSSKRRRVSTSKTTDNFVYFESSEDESKPVEDYTPPIAPPRSTCWSNAIENAMPLFTSVYTHQLQELIQGLKGGDTPVPDAVEQLENMLANGDSGDSTRR